LFWSHIGEREIKLNVEPFSSFEELKIDEPRDGKMRNQWEYSHVVRAGFALVSLMAIVLAVSVNR
jgi:hypothetical protein